MTKKTPQYCSKKNTNGKNYGYVTISGKRINLGPDGPISQEKHRRVIAELLPGHNTPTPASGKNITVNQLFAKFLQHAKIHYRKPNGRPQVFVFLKFISTISLAD